MKKSKKMKLLALLLALVLATAGLGLLFLPASASITATGNWYKSTQSTLYINNASDLWAFATALQNNKTFAGQTVKLTADITVNDGWDAFGGSTPGDKWPLTSVGKYFAGTFDGQGHTISGLYASVSGFGYGFFGNVPRGKTATVKNLKIVNSKILNEDGGRTGGIFGYISTESDVRIFDDYYVNTTKAVIEMVSLNLNIVAKGAYSGGDNGVGGFIGCSATDVQITNSSFDGKVTTPTRGVAAFVGAVYPAQISYDHDGDGATTAFYPNDTNGDGICNSKDTAVYYKNNTQSAGVGTGNVKANAYKTYTRIENCVAKGTLDASESEAIRFVGALLGYANSNTNEITAKNVIAACELVGTHASNAPLGYLYGGTWCSANSYRNDVTVDYHVLNLENVFVSKISGEAYPIYGRTTAGVKIEGEAKNFADLKEYLSTSILQNLTLRNDLCYNLYLPIIDDDATVLLNGEPVAATEDGGWFDRYALDGILPQQMTDTVSLYIKQTIGGEVFEVRKTTSIRSYLYSLWNTDTLSDAERNLIADLLRYGAAAQTYANYNSSSLVTTGFSLARWGTEFDASSIATRYAKVGVGNAQYDVTDAALALNNALSMYFRFTAADLSGLSVDVTVGERTETYTSFTKIGTNTYMFSCDVIYAHEMGLPITVTLKQNGSQIGQQLTYSVADYVKALLAQDATGNATLTDQQELVRKLYAYGLSADAYNDSTRCVITDGLTSDYVIVYDDTASADVVASAHQLAKNIEEKTGVRLDVVKDTVAETAREILVGNVNGRSASRSEVALIGATDANGYRIRVVGDKIVLAGVSEHLIRYAVDRLSQAITTHGGVTWSIPLSYCEIVDVPTLATTATTSRAVYYAGDHNYTWSYTSSSSNFTSEYASYVSALKNAGFVEYTTNTIANNTFGTYVKTTDGYQTAVYTMHYPNTKNMRITYGPIGFMPSLDECDPETYSSVVTPSIVMNARETAYLSASGMSYIFQLTDGSFILIDGGSNDTTVTTKDKVDGTWVENEAKVSEDAQALYELLDEMAPGNAKPVISAWFISHAHGDHINMANQFLLDYHTLVDVKMTVQNFPDFESVTISWDGVAGTASMNTAANTFINRAKTFYPDIDIWTCHSGQKLYLPDCEIEILYTPEDYYGDKNNTTEMTFTSGNETCINFRVRFGGVDVMVLGDSGWTILERMANNYGEEMESDILQVTHHGSNGGNYPFYAVVDPKICLWAVDDCRFETGEYQLGSSTGGKTGNSYMYANWWIRNTEWTRADGSSGVREHYSISATEHRTIVLNLPSGGGVVVTPQLPLN